MAPQVVIIPSSDARGARLSWTPEAPAWPLDEGGVMPAECAALIDGGVVRARCSTWRGETPKYRGLPTTFVGHVAGADRESLRTLLEGVVARCGEDEPRWLLGPIDGTTWRRYRVVVDPGVEPVFPMEPTNPRWWGAAFEGAGFEVVERYWSASRDIMRDPPARPGSPPAGIRIRSLEADRLEEELSAIYELAVQAFDANPLYTPITRDEFVRMYEPLASRLSRGLCLIAEDEAGTPVGVMFSLPADDDRLVLKSIAVGEAYRGQGLGAALLGEAAWRGAQRRFKRLIFALMHEQNASSRMVSKLGSACRAYALYGRRIGA